MYEPYGNMYGNMYNYQRPQRYEIIKVNGRGGAEAFQMAPNSEVLLLDTTAPVVWLKTTDGAGFATCTPYPITQPQPEPQLKDLVERIERLEGLINESDNAAS